MNTAYFQCTTHPVPVAMKFEVLRNKLCATYVLLLAFKQYVLLFQNFSFEPLLSSDHAHEGENP